MDSRFPGGFSRIFGKEYGVLVGSGLLGIESALCLLDIPYDAKIIIPSLSCWKLAFAIKRLGFEPLICPSGRNLLLNLSYLKRPEFSRAAAIIAVHQFGLPLDVCRIRQILPKIKIVEDVAQGWRLEASGHKIGAFSDIVVTSFGPRKPISFGYGGGTFFNSACLLERFDLSLQRQLRRARDIPIPYALPIPSAKSIKSAVRLADRSLVQRRSLVSKLKDSSSRFSIWKENDGDSPAWSRVPVFCPSISEKLRLMAYLDRLGLPFQEVESERLKEIAFLGLEASKSGSNMEDCVLLRPEENARVWNNFSWSELDG